MSTYHGRPLSPGGRRNPPSGRTSTGSFVTPSTYYDYPVPSRASRDYVPGPRSSADRVDGARVNALRQRSPPRRARNDDYEVRSRPRTLSMDPGDSHSRRPLSLMAPPPTNKITRPIIIRDGDGPPSPLSKKGGAQLESSYIIPASSASGRHHHRHSSLTTGDRLATKEGNRGERIYPSGGYHLRPPPQKPARDERDYGYEYTNPREEVLRDLTPRQRPRRESYTSARPTSMINLERSDKMYTRMDKDAPLSTAPRGSEDVARSDSLRRSVRPRDDDLDRRDSIARGHRRDERDDGRYREPARSQIPPREDYVPYMEESTRHQRPRKPTLEDERPLQNVRDLIDDRLGRGEDRPRKSNHREHGARKDLDGRDDRDRRKDYDDTDRRVRDEPRERRDKGEEAGSHVGLLAGAGAGAATVAGLAAEGARRHRHRDEDARSSKDFSGHSKQPDQASETTSISGDTRPSGDADEGDREERRRRRRREREKEDHEYREAREESQRRIQDPGVARAEGGQQLVVPQPNEQGLRQQKSYERRSDVMDDDPRPRRRDHRRRHHSHTRNSDSYSDPSSPESDSSSIDRLPRQPPRVVTPSDSAEPPKPAPKGILKPPREKFPEEPSTVREGVAPLDAAKKGIPPEARWTRINRRLVNPEALDMEGIRFEEFPDHVIVLKVLSPEEISRFTKMTHEIRERRRLADGGSGSGSGGASGGGS